jgi:hypothetical protein
MKKRLYWVGFASDLDILDYDKKYEIHLILNIWTPEMKMKLKYDKIASDNDLFWNITLFKRYK